MPGGARRVHRTAAVSLRPEHERRTRPGRDASGDDRDQVGARDRARHNQQEQRHRSGTGHSGSDARPARRTGAQAQRPSAWPSGSPHDQPLPPRTSSPAEATVGARLAPVEAERLQDRQVAPADGRTAKDERLQRAPRSRPRPAAPRCTPAGGSLTHTEVARRETRKAGRWSNKEPSCSFASVLARSAPGAIRAWRTSRGHSVNAAPIRTALDHVIAAPSPRLLRRRIAGREHAATDDPHAFPKGASHLDRVPIRRPSARNVFVPRRISSSLLGAGLITVGGRDPLRSGHRPHDHVPPLHRRSSRRRPTQRR